MARGLGGTAVASRGTPAAAQRTLRRITVRIDPIAHWEDTAGCERPAWTGEAGLPGGTQATLVGWDAAVLVGFGLLAGIGSPATLVAAAATALAYALLGLYRARLTLSALDDLPRLLGGFAAGTAVASTVAGVLHPDSPPQRVLLFCTAAVPALAFTRGLLYLRIRLRRRQRAGWSTLILGTGQVGRLLGRKLLEHPEHGLRPVGYLDDGVPAARRALPAPLLGSHRDLARTISTLDVRCVLVAFGTVRQSELVAMLRTCDRLHCEVLFVPRLFELHAGTRDTDYVQGIPLQRIRRAPFRRPSWRAKRALDVAVSAASLTVLAPAFALLGIAVRLEGGPGVLFRQERVGLDGRRFQMLKFRSLRPASDGESQTRWSVTNDARIGPVGRILRATSLDELPQLVNVLRGDMSLVGPRPERPYFVDLFSRRYPRYFARHRVPAGMTGWAAVNGLRGDTSITDRVRYDNFYVENWSLWLDLKIMVRTVASVFGRSGG